VCGVCVHVVVWTNGFFWRLFQAPFDRLFYASEDDTFARRSFQQGTESEGAANCREGPRCAAVRTDKGNYCAFLLFWCFSDHCGKYHCTGHCPLMEKKCRVLRNSVSSDHYCWHTGSSQLKTLAVNWSRPSSQHGLYASLMAACLSG